ncbi:DUF1129 family protein [Neobacillus kokaensis]|uniref:DUF1129 domain-containing protein n=1 Tax=Neobacillus kokaensis TaxID=2759023 RepID=A0ABQ3N7W3_9BACI|nr:DUF1129 family protein [Neobacillus kokaensis]GHI01046.1 hypothetical protein AM1BK_45880 [Neobacillus kokaensis]
MEAKQLIELNNQRRTELTAENEKYYNDFMLYIRLQFFLSEQQSEEILMEILEHLIEGQKEGKTAADVFGDDPKAFADELIEQLPNENKKSIVQFFSRIAFNLFSYFLIIHGLIVLIGSFFKEVDSVVYPVKAAMISLLIFVFSLFGVWFIFGIINQSLFKEKKSTVTDYIKIGLIGSIGMGLIIAAGYFLPNIGPSLYLPWYAYFILGGLIWGISWVMKK